MKTMKKFASVILSGLLGASVLSGCATHTYAETDPSLIVSASGLSEYMGQEGVVIVDMQSAEDYAAEHLEGAVNIPVSDIVINVPVENMLTSKKKVESVMGAAGISNDSTVIAYDTDRMSASRLLWTLWMYGFDNVRVVSGGLDAIRAAGLNMTTEVPQVTEASFIYHQRARLCRS